MDRYAPCERSRRPSIPDPGLAGPLLDTRERAVCWLDAQRPILIAAAIQAAEHGLPEYTNRMSAVVWRYLHTGGHYHDAEVLHSCALRTADPADAGREHGNLGRVYWHQDQYEQALEHSRRALALARDAGDRAGELRAASYLAAACARLGRYPEALKHNQTALAIARELGGRPSEEGGRSAIWAACTGRSASTRWRWRGSRRRWQSPASWATGSARASR